MAAELQQITRPAAMHGEERPYPLKKQGLSALHVSKKMHGKPKKCLTGLWTRYIIIVVPQSCFYGHDTMIKTIFY